jgi:hypothetical protein
MQKLGMTHRRKAQLINFGTVVGLAILLVIGALRRMPLAMIIAYCAAATIAAFLVQCPACRKPVMWNPFGEFDPTRPNQSLEPTAGRREVHL